MEFIRELNESRLFKKLEYVYGRNMNDIATRLFEHLLALQIFANEDRGTAKKYATKMMEASGFDGFRTSQLDLYNLITLILNPEKYSYLFADDTKFVIPELRLRRNLLALKRGSFDNNDYSYMMLMLQQQFKDIPPYLYVLRRQISDWKRLTSNQKSEVAQRLLYMMREKSSMQSDLYMLLQRLQKTI